MKKKYIALLLSLPLLSGCQFYRPGQISGAVFGGLANDDAILIAPTPWGRAVRVGGSATNNVMIEPDGTVIRWRCKCEKPTL